MSFAAIRRVTGVVSTTRASSKAAPVQLGALAGSSAGPPPVGLSEPARRIRDLSINLWSEERAVDIVGQSPPLVALLARLEKIAAYQEPVLILGESGVGKESLAQAIHLLSGRGHQPFVSVNCPQYLEGNLTVSELFGHKKGSFTGAVADRKGCFETAHGGVIFLDEIGDLHMSAQVMLLRALATGEFQPLGSDVLRKVSVRVVAATNRSLNQLAAQQHFRRDLLFRLRYFLLEIPPLRERGEDWRLLTDHFLCRLHRRHGVAKRFTVESLRLLRDYSWPGNVRQLMSVVTAGYALSDGDLIEPRDFIDQLDLENESPDGEGHLDLVFRRLSHHSGDFWALVQEPFLDRDLSRHDVRRLVGRGLREAGFSYRRLLDLWGMPAAHYQKFMDFLRHHRLKPRSSEADES